VSSMEILPNYMDGASGHPYGPFGGNALLVLGGIFLVFVILTIVLFFHGHERGGCFKMRKI